MDQIVEEQNSKCTKKESKLGISKDFNSFNQVIHFHNMLSHLASSIILFSYQSHHKHTC